MGKKEAGSGVASLEKKVYLEGVRGGPGHGPRRSGWQNVTKRGNEKRPRGKKILGDRRKGETTQGGDRSPTGNNERKRKKK